MKQALEAPLILESVAQERGVIVREGVAVEGVEAGKVKLVGGEVLPFDECCWCTGAAAPTWLRQTQLPLGMPAARVKVCLGGVQ
jgi:NADH dehydrogenase FAD-containing subunit